MGVLSSHPIISTTDASQVGTLFPTCLHFGWCPDGDEMIRHPKGCRFAALVEVERGRHDWCDWRNRRDWRVRCALLVELALLVKTVDAVDIGLFLVMHGLRLRIRIIVHDICPELVEGPVVIVVAEDRVNKSESKTGNASVEIKETKTVGSTRKITLDSNTVEFLKAEKEAQRLTLAFYHVEQTDKTPVACDFRGNWYRPSCFTSAFIVFRDDHGFNGVRLHDLRHTQATLLLKNGEDILTVSRRLGHAKASTTLDVYGHVLPGMDKEAAELFGSVVARAGKE